MKQVVLCFANQAAADEVLAAVALLARDDVGDGAGDWLVLAVVDDALPDALLPYRIEPPSGIRRFAGVDDWTPPSAPPPPAPPPAPESAAAARARLKAAATEQRWLHEQGGLTLPHGVRVLTGKADQDRITSVIVNAQLAGITSVDFKADSGWVTLSMEQVKAIATAIALHVQACFTAERVHHNAIDSCADADLAGYDVSAGWP